MVTWAISEPTVTIMRFPVNATIGQTDCGDRFYKPLHSKNLMPENNAPYTHGPNGSSAQSTCFESQIKRLHEVCGTTSLHGLANFLGVGLPELTDAKRRGKMPKKWLGILVQKGLDAAWVLNGDV